MAMVDEVLVIEQLRRMVEAAGWEVVVTDRSSGFLSVTVRRPKPASVSSAAVTAVK